MKHLSPLQTILLFVHDRVTLSITTDEETVPGVYLVRDSDGNTLARFRITTGSEAPAAEAHLDGDENLTLAASTALRRQGLPGMDRGLAIAETFLVQALNALRMARGRSLSGRTVGSPEGMAMLREAFTLASTAAEDVRSVHGPLFLGKWTEPWPEEPLRAADATADRPTP